MNSPKIIGSDSFAGQLRQCSKQLRRQRIDTLQVNIGKRCNQACHHCHVESGPQHPDNMEAATVDRLIELLSHSDIHSVDITGGAPELNPHFRRFVRAVRKLGIDVINRCNLTVLFEPGQHDSVDFFAQQRLKIVASLPCYSPANVEAQRGKGVFSSSIEALQKLNRAGFGSADSGLQLDLVYNPLGATLPPPQQTLEQDYRRRLFDDFGIVFNSLYTITNMPIKRFAHQLQRDGELAAYYQLLRDNFNPAAVDGLMCLSQLSVGFDGRLYDCDFNQMLELSAGGRPQNIFEIDSFSDIGEGIATGDHCLACTAGSGSSCGGTLV